MKTNRVKYLIILAIGIFLFTISFVISYIYLNSIRFDIENFDKYSIYAYSNLVNRHLDYIPYILVLLSISRSIIGIFGLIFNKTVNYHCSKQSFLLISLTTIALSSATVFLYDFLNDIYWSNLIVNFVPTIKSLFYRYPFDFPITIVCVIGFLVLFVILLIKWLKYRKENDMSKTSLFIEIGLAFTSFNTLSYIFYIGLNALELLDIFGWIK